MSDCFGTASKQRVDSLVRNVLIVSMCYIYNRCVTLDNMVMTSKTVSIREMRNALGNLETLVLESGELIVTKRGKAIALCCRSRAGKTGRTMPICVAACRA